MNFIKYMPITILIYFSLKLLIKFLEENIYSLREQLELLKIEKGMLSIKDLQKENYTRFLKTVDLYLSTHGYENITIFPNNHSELTNLMGELNKEHVYISCLQNNMLGETAKDEDHWQSTGRPEIQRFLARMTQHNCSKGIIIINSTFSKEAISFVDTYNTKNLCNKILLVDGYELTRAIRSYNAYKIKEEINFEPK